MNDDTLKAMSATELTLAIVMLVGLVGVVVPIVPGLLLVAGAGVVWALERSSPGAWGLAAVMVAVAAGATVASTVLPARRTSARGAPWWIVAAGAAGVVVGFFLVPVIGAVIGFPAGVFVAEVLRHRSVAPALRSTREAMQGVALGIMIQLLAGVAMIGTWLVVVMVTE